MVDGKVYESAVQGRQDFRRAFRDQKAKTDRYGLALLMIREGCADPKGVAERALAEPVEDR